MTMHHDTKGKKTVQGDVVPAVQQGDQGKKTPSTISEAFDMGYRLPEDEVAIKKIWMQNSSIAKMVQNARKSLGLDKDLVSDSGRETPKTVLDAFKQGYRLPEDEKLINEIAKRARPRNS